MLNLRARSSALSVQGVRRVFNRAVVTALTARNAVGLKSASTVVGALSARSAAGLKSASTVVSAISARSAVGLKSASTGVGAIRARSAAGLQSASTVAPLLLQGVRWVSNLRARYPVSVAPRINQSRDECASSSSRQRREVKNVTFGKMRGNTFTFTKEGKSYQENSVPCTPAAFLSRPMTGTPLDITAPASPPPSAASTTAASASPSDARRPRPPVHSRAVGEQQPGHRRPRRPRPVAPPRPAPRPSPRVRVPVRANRARRTPGRGAPRERRAPPRRWPSTRARTSPSSRRERHRRTWP